MKPKEGYHFVKWLFRQQKEIPLDWNFLPLDKVGKIVTGNTPKTSHKEYYGDEYLWTTPNDIEFEKYVGDTETKLTSKGFENAREIPKNSIMVVCIASIGKIGIASKIMSTNQQINSIICFDDFDPEFVYYQLRNNANTLLNISNQSVVPILNKTDFGCYYIAVPKNKKEQEYISLKLSALDTLISQIREIIKQNNFLKEGLLQTIFVNGFSKHSKKPVNLGKQFLNVNIPKHWDAIPFKEVINVQENPVDLVDDLDYTRIIVKRRHGGITLRDIVKGKEILVKNQFKIRSGDFIISKRQIYHIACGLIPKQFDGAVVSNEYSNYSGSDLLDINYFDLFSQTNLFKKTINVTTQGVDVEKYIFLQDEWLNLKMPLPPPDEQEKMIKIFKNLDERIIQDTEYISHLEILKKGLMQKLLSGELRVKI